MKIALVLSGNPNYYNTSFPYIKKHIIDLYDCDVFYHLWYNSDDIGKNYRSGLGHITDVIDSDTPDKLFELYKPLDYIIETPRTFDVPYKRNTDANPSDNKSMIYSWCKGIRLATNYALQNSFEYQCIVKTRFDCGVLSDLIINPGDLDKMNYTHSIFNPNVPCDWLNWGNRFVMSKYAELDDNFDEYCKSGVLICGEEMLNHHLNKNSIKKKSHDISLYLVRDKDFNDKSHFGRMW